MRGFRRLTAWVLLVVFSASLWPPMVRAQSNYDPYSIEDEQAYASEVQDRLALKTSLEDQYQQAVTREAELKKQLEQLDAYKPTTEADRSWWQTQKDNLQQAYDGNKGNLDRFKTTLTDTYNKLTKDYDKVKDSKSPQLQQLGAAIGAAGSGEWGYSMFVRPTASQVGGAIHHVGQEVRLKTVNARIGPDGTSGAYNKWATSLGEGSAAHAANAQTIAGTKWEFVPAENGGGMLKPKLPDGTYGKGSVTVPKDIAKNPEALKAFTDYHLSLKNSAWNVTNELALTKQQLLKTTDAAGQKVLQSRIKSLTETQSKLNADIAKYEAETPEYASPKGQLKNLAIGAAKWAAVSCAITVGANAISQMSQNGWDPRKVDWKQATADLRTWSFWGGTAGSFAGSWVGTMIASALPGGPFVKALFAVGGAALGWQLGSGNLANTDWVGLGVSTVGATIGMLIGQAICPIPGLGAILGGIAGHLVSTWILGKVRDWLAKPTATSDSVASAPSGYGDGYSSPSYSQDGGGYTGSDPSQSGYSSSGSADQAAQLGKERDQLYKEYLAAQQESPRDQGKLQELWEKFKAKVNDLRGVQSKTSYSDFK